MVRGPLPGEAVSIHAPAWGATRTWSGTGRARSFQSTPPRGGRHHRPRRPQGLAGFNPRPRVGGDVVVRCASGVGHLVSIHAPAWGATGEPPRQEAIHHGFNPRPRVGGDLGSDSATIGCTRFNPRPRVGGDSVGHVAGETVLVSIHAPAWGATPSIASIVRADGFQSTPPRGGRLGPAPLGTTCPLGFNPRPRVGGDRARG